MEDNYWNFQWPDSRIFRIDGTFYNRNRVVYEISMDENRVLCASQANSHQISCPFRYDSRSNYSPYPSWLSFSCHSRFKTSIPHRQSLLWRNSKSCPTNNPISATISWYAVPLVLLYAHLFDPRLLFVFVKRFKSGDLMTISIIAVLIVILS